MSPTAVAGFRSARGWASAIGFAGLTLAMAITFEEVTHNVLMRTVLGEWGAYRFVRVDPRPPLPTAAEWAVIDLGGAMAQQLLVGALVGAAVVTRFKHFPVGAAALLNVWIDVLGKGVVWLSASLNPVTSVPWVKDLPMVARFTPSSEYAALHFVHAALVGPTILFAVAATVVFWRSRIGGNNKLNLALAASAGFALGMLLVGVPAVISGVPISQII